MCITRIICLFGASLLQVGDHLPPDAVLARQVTLLLFLVDPLDDLVLLPDGEALTPNSLALGPALGLCLWRGGAC